MVSLPIHEGAWLQAFALPQNPVVRQAHHEGFGTRRATFCSADDARGGFPLYPAKLIALGMGEFILKRWWLERGAAISVALMVSLSNHEGLGG
jgi:hypothetical protein